MTLTLPISAVVGAGIVLWTVGGEYFAELSQAARLVTLRDDAIDWIRILIERGYAPQLTPYAVGLGVLMWVTAFIAAYTMYRHHRVLDAILLVGALMIVNMSATLTDLFPYLVLFMLAALLLWLRAALIGREEGWQRRRVNENSEVPSATCAAAWPSSPEAWCSHRPHPGRGGGATDRRVEQPGHGLDRRRGRGVLGRMGARDGGDDLEHERHRRSKETHE